jgi:uncharacterized protein YjiS (DUF1127 family)
MERAMNTTTMTTTRTFRPRWNQIKLSIAEWQRRTLSRQELQGLSDATLRDIGITRCEANSEIHKPFWMA